jgi:glycosyltransferase involved in cell wall biosynthesis
MDKIQFDCLKLADRIVFQSNFALEMFRQFGYRDNNFSVIHNGVNQKLFNLEGRVYWNKKDKLKAVSCSWSANPAKGHKIIADFSELKDVEISFIGRWAKEIPVKNVRIIPALPQDKISQEFKKHHIFIFPSLNEACSNTLLEALSSGLPVIYVSSGSNEELAGNYGVCLQDNNLRESISKIKIRYGELIENIKKDRYKFSIEYIGRQYINICRELVNGTN